VRGKCKLLRQRQISCPEYGITVLHSSIPSDKEYTIAGLPMVNDINIEQENRLAINLNQTEGHNPLKVQSEDDEQPVHGSKKQSCYNFWKLKLLHYKTRETMVVQSHITHQERKKGVDNREEEKIDKLKDTLNRIERIWRRRLNNYNTMTKIYDRNIKSNFVELNI
jgi:hypothetical protein